jgi:hypothetical protein
VSPQAALDRFIVSRRQVVRSAAVMLAAGNPSNIAFKDSAKTGYNRGPNRMFRIGSGSTLQRTRPYDEDNAVAKNPIALKRASIISGFRSRGFRTTSINV